MSILPNAYTITKSGDNVILPNKQTITKNQFIDRMGSMGFRTDATENILRCLTEGGHWELSMNNKQRRVLESDNKQVKRGFM